jgi:hypothetical protein
MNQYFFKLELDLKELESHKNEAKKAQLGKGEGNFVLVNSNNSDNNVLLEYS